MWIGLELVGTPPASGKRLRARAHHHAQHTAAQRLTRMRVARTHAERAVSETERMETPTWPTPQQGAKSAAAVIVSTQQAEEVDPERPRGAALLEKTRRGSQLSVLVKVVMSGGYIVRIGDFANMCYVAMAVSPTGPMNHAWLQDPAIGHWMMRNGGPMASWRKISTDRMGTDTVEGIPGEQLVDPSSV